MWISSYHIFCFSIWFFRSTSIFSSTMANHSSRTVAYLERSVETEHRFSRRLLDDIRALRVENTNLRVENTNLGVQLEGTAEDSRRAQIRAKIRRAWLNKHAEQVRG